MGSLKKGGARNKANRASEQLSESDCVKIIGASEAARRAGMPLNRFITIAWGHSGIARPLSVPLTGQFIESARKWMAGHGHPMPWCWVQEWGPRFGAHCHLLLHVPKELEPLFRPMPLRWVKGIIGKQYSAGTLQSQRLRAAHNANPDHYRAELYGKLHYMLKCAPADWERELGMAGKGHKPWGQSCPVIGKRAGVWQGWKRYS